jgi:hypothetical protein
LTHDYKIMFRILHILILLTLISCGADAGDDFPPNECPMPSNPDPVFPHHLTDLTHISTIHPMGAAWGGGIHVNGHTYLQISPRYQGISVPVYAPVDSRLERIIKAREPNGEYDWAFTMRVSCEVVYIMTHLTHPVQAIEDVWEGPPSVDSSDFMYLNDDNYIYFKAGDLIAYTTGTQAANNWDFGVYHTEHYNDFISPERFYHPVLKGEISRMLNSVCPYPFFIQELREQYEALYGNLLLDRPVPGAHCRQVSRDKLGTIAGTWYRVSGDPEFYKEIVGIGSEFGGDVIVGGIAGASRSWRVLAQSDVEPKTVTDSHCYYDGGHFGYLKLINDMLMHVYYGTGECPDEFPDSGYAVYER